MISYIKGLLAEKAEDSVVVEAQGVGYHIFVPSSLLSELPPLGETVKIYTYFKCYTTACEKYKQYLFVK